VALRDRHLVGVGAAACAVCCAAPVLGLLGLAGAGAAATMATFVFAGTVFALVVGGAAVVGLLIRRRTGQAATVCEIPETGPVLLDSPPDAAGRGVPSVIAPDGL
jgi:hypothetical protein